MSFLLNRLWLVVKVYHFTCTVLLLCLVPLLVNSLFVAGIPVVQCDNPMLCFVSPNIYIYQYIMYRWDTVHAEQVVC